MLPDAKDAESKIKNFRKVTTDLYRGSQPSGKDFDVLKNLGIKTVVTLRWKKKLIEVERKECEQRDLQLVSIPLNYTNPPKLKDINCFLEVIGSENNRPIYVHCMHGVDRTGIMIALYRIIIDNWTVEEAYTEMEKCGFHKYRLRPFKWQLFKFARYIAKNKKEFVN